MDHLLIGFARFVQELSFVQLDRQNRADFAEVARDAVELCRLAHAPNGDEVDEDRIDADLSRLYDLAAGYGLRPGNDRCSFWAHDSSKVLIPRLPAC